jgi:hypothetical protein
MKIVILGNRRTCSMCRYLKKVAPVAALVAEFPGAEVIDADKSENLEAYKKFAPSVEPLMPAVRVIGDEPDDSGEMFVARSMTLAGIVAGVKKVAVGSGSGQFENCGPAEKKPKAKAKAQKKCVNA